MAQALPAQELISLAKMLFVCFENLSEVNNSLVHSAAGLRGAGCSRWGTALTATLTLRTESFIHSPFTLYTDSQSFN